ncbi:MAG: LysR family transcriptional regulator substrate-binding protein [Synergistaceae bacterium]|nr:LysR family transcriptional regulator substrate-binding protein [Synergistaceae bacterium]
MKFFLLFREHAVRTFCEKYFREHSIRPEVVMEFPSNITCCRMAASVMGAAIIPRLTAEMTDAGNKTELFSLDDEPVTWEVRAFFRKGAYIGEPEHELITMAGEIFSA